MPNIYQTVQHDLLAANGLSAEMLAQSLSLIGSRQVDYADIYCQRTAFESWHLEEGMVKSGSFQMDQRRGRACSGGRENRVCLCRQSQCRSHRPCRRGRARDWCGGEQAEVRVPSVRRGKKVHAVANPIASLDSADKVALLDKVEALARATDPRMAQVMAGLASEYDVVLVARARRHPGRRCAPAGAPVGHRDCRAGRPARSGLRRRRWPLWSGLFRRCTLASMWTRRCARL